MQRLRRHRFRQLRISGQRISSGLLCPDWHDYNPPVINGSRATLEQINRLYPTEESALREEDRKRPVQLVQTEEAWALHLPTGEIVPLDQAFTSQAFFWE